MSDITFTPYYLLSSKHQVNQSELSLGVRERGEHFKRGELSHPRTAYSATAGSKSAVYPSLRELTDRGTRVQPLVKQLRMKEWR